MSFRIPAVALATLLVPCPPAVCQDAAPPARAQDPAPSPTRPLQVPGAAAVREVDRLQQARPTLLRSPVTAEELEAFAGTLTALEVWVSQNRAAWSEALAGCEPLVALRALAFWREQGADPDAYVATREKLDMLEDVVSGSLQIESLEKQAATLRRLLEEANMTEEGRITLRLNVGMVEGMMRALRAYPEENLEFWEKRGDEIVALLARVDSLAEVDARPPLLLDGASRGFRLYGSGRWKAAPRERGALATLALTAPPCRLVCRSVRWKGDGRWTEEVARTVFEQVVRGDRACTVEEEQVAVAGKVRARCDYLVEEGDEVVRGRMLVAVIGPRLLVLSFEAPASRWNESASHVAELTEFLEILPEAAGAGAGTLR